MGQLTFKYSADQQYQLDAIDAVCDLFRGQEFLDARFMADLAAPTQEGIPGIAAPAQQQIFSVGHANGLRVSARQLEENLHAVQERNNLPATRDLTGGRLRDFSVEMETGTGKTYVYTRTIYELNRRYGLTKFVIVVPSVAIREGVRKSFESTRSHFEGLYDHTPLECFVYDSSRLGAITNFAVSSSIQVMIINIGAFNKELDKDARKGVTNIFHRPSEKLIGGRSPQELVSSCNPIVIIDEPQSVDNTAKAQRAIDTLNPLFVLRYSATHRKRLNMVYQLGPVEAFQRHLVKGIVVDSVQSQADLNGAFVRLDSVDNKSGYAAKLTIDSREERGGQKRKRVTVRTGADLYQKSNENTDYEDGWIVSNIGTEPGQEFVEFENGTYLELGESHGDPESDAVKRAQIAETIEDHLDRQLRLRPLGIKVLSLFFIDKVEKYRVYEGKGGDWRKGEYAQIFEDEYRRIASSERWRRRYERAGVELPQDPEPLHAGYFAQDGKGKFKDTKESASTNADTSAFELIMRKKETLVSLPDGRDPEKDVCFIWSHSALKEGWDNPNVFQICTLVETRDTLTKRQKIGRGLRLPVNNEGERCLDPDVNVLTVISNESYRDFAKGLQREFEEGGYRFGVLSPESFTSLVLRGPDGGEEMLGHERSKRVYEKLEERGLVEATGSKRGAIKPELKAAAEKGEVPLPEEVADVEGVQEQVCGIVLHKAERLQIRDKSKEVEVELEKDVSADPAFQALWERIRQTTRFEMNVDTDDLVARAVEGVRQMPRVKPVEVLSMSAGLNVGDSGVSANEKSVRTSLVRTDAAHVYDLPDPLSELQDRVGLTRGTIARILEGSGRMGEFKVDPMTFLSQVAERIEAAKNQVVAKGIKYTRLPESQWYTMDVLAVNDLRAYLGQNAWEPLHHKSLYSYVVYDSSSIEKPYAVALDRAEEVRVFAKLPSKFKIDTPLGSYNPDWAYVEEGEDGHRRVYFVVETKGKQRGQNRPTEEAKISCAEKHFEALDLGDDFHYDVEVEYHYAHA
ncbi:MAG: DEAD/DEAH box helicase family protein [Olsenella sp.]|jgi:type III restriction enzyme|nr:DEAD/DEAH box helicase family protein [Olsenella sp.]